MPGQTEIILKGQGGAPGIALGKIFVLPRNIVPRGADSIDPSLAELELEKFQKALANTKKELVEITRTVAQELDPQHKQIFEAQIMLLDDPEVRKEVEKEVRVNLKSAGTAYREVLEKSLAALTASDNSYLRERVADIQALKTRVLGQLAGQKLHSAVQLHSPAIILAETLSPGELIQLERKNVLGLAVKEAGVTSHVTLLAKAFNIPAVVAWEDRAGQIENETIAILDGNAGEVIISPREETVQVYKKKRKIWEEELEEIQKSSKLPALTKDRVRITLLANLDVPEEADQALQYGADGVGLFRTEFLYLGSAGFPSEEEQYQVYSKILERFHPRPVTIRSIDLGGDKLFGAADEFRDANPSLGWRGVRVCLDSPALFKTQLRALLRGSVKGKLRIMIPMVSSEGEIEQALKIIREVKQQLRKEKVKFDQRIPVGMMVEIPSAALNAAGLAQKVDFMSLGTNDLTQYTLAVDRGNKRVAHLFEELDPAVIKLIQMTAEAGRKNRVGVSVCGELAGSTLALPLLLGLGIRELSVSPVHIPRVKTNLARIKLAPARKLAARVCKLTERREVKRLLQQFSS